MSLWQDKRVTVTGGAGFLGSFVVRRLKEEGADVFVVRSRDYDLIQRQAAARLYAAARPELLIHLAARVGGIGANRENPGRFFFENMALGLNVIEEARRYGKLEKLVIVGTTCSYPKFTPTPFHESDLWNGYPEETNAPYGIAKKALLVMAQGYRQQYGLKMAYLIPANLYGPGDNFDPKSSHVIPALIHKFVEAQEQGADHIVAWGSGRVSREFLYVSDAAEGIVRAAERYEGPEPVNLGTGEEITIADLALLIKELAGFEGEIRWDPRQPDGQPRRRLETSKAQKLFGFSARTPLREGLRETIEWYRTWQRGVARTSHTNE